MTRKYWSAKFWAGLLVISSMTSATLYGVELRSLPNPGELRSNELALEVKGELRVMGEKQLQPLPMSVSATAKFTERRVDDGSLADEIRTLRHYSEAKATIRIHNESTINRLSKKQGVVRGKLSQNKLQLIAAQAPLTRDERDLLDLSGDPLSLAALLPAGDVDVGGTWTVPSEKLAAIYGLDEVKRSEVTLKLAKFQDNLATLSLTGKLNGTVMGSSTAMTLGGTLTFNAKTGNFDDWTLTIKEQRDPGLASPGLDVTAKLTAQAKTVFEAKELSDETLAGLALIDDQQEERLSYLQRHSIYRFQYDPRWKIRSDESHQLSMQLLEGNLIAAQANVRMVQLPASAPSLQLKEFEQEVKTSIGKNFVKFQDKHEGVNPLGVRTLKIVSEGIVETVPVLWLSYYFEGPDGYRVAITISLEDKMLEQFGTADKAFLETMEFNEAIQQAKVQVFDVSDK
jgi:hypothetical protein